MMDEMTRRDFEPTPDDLADPLFQIIWQGIKHHDVPYPDTMAALSDGSTLRTISIRSGATGNDVMMILRPLREHLAAAAAGH